MCNYLYYWIYVINLYFTVSFRSAVRCKWCLMLQLKSVVREKIIIDLCTILRRKIYVFLLGSNYLTECLKSSSIERPDQARRVLE